MTAADRIVANLRCGVTSSDGAGAEPLHRFPLLDPLRALGGHLGAARAHGDLRRRLRRLVLRALPRPPRHRRAVLLPPLGLPALPALRRGAGRGNSSERASRTTASGGSSGSSRPTGPSSRWRPSCPAWRGSSAATGGCTTGCSRTIRLRSHGHVCRRSLPLRHPDRLDPVDRGVLLPDAAALRAGHGVARRAVARRLAAARAGGRRRDQRHLDRDPELGPRRTTSTPGCSSRRSAGGGGSAWVWRSRPSRSS